VHPLATSIAKRLATTVALMLFVGTLPVAMICCVDQTICTTTAMHASMPCCAGSCTMSRQNRGHDNDATLTATPSLRAGTGSAVAIVAAVPVKVSIVMASNDHLADGFSPSPPILLNEQFRI
jgi:hypothetical protein